MDGLRQPSMPDLANEFTGLTSAMEGMEGLRAYRHLKRGFGDWPSSDAI